MKPRPAQPDVFGEALASVASLSLAGEWGRFKTCRALGVRGSKAAMRAYRERKKAASS
ncbi:hypothetical protein [Kutzneria buriramensis]|uniref:hypothetical protein n=1 Tax=Kutzneria buriramensis TaxID=1045776 RepID=UPI001476AAD1|nr:hypothetical protein [Kutzneria buriramensis]